MYGHSDSANLQPLSTKSVFEIGSITKTFTALLLADLVKKGKVKLDDPIEKYLPDSVSVPSFKGQKITFADLASHTSGLPSIPNNFNPKDLMNPFFDYNVKQLYAFLTTYQLKRAVGQYEYSNLGVAILAHTLTLISGKNYEEMLQEVICKPLAMTATNTLDSSLLFTTGHTSIRSVPHWTFQVFQGVGAIRSNAEDMLRYVKAQMGLLSTTLKPAIELTQQPLHQIGEKSSIGLVWNIRSISDDEIVWHGGATGGFNTFAGFSRKTNRAIIILNNSRQQMADLAMYYFNPTPKELMPIKQAMAVSKELLQTYVGRYQIAPDSTFDIQLSGSQLILRDNKFIFNYTGQPFIELYPESKDRFFSRVSNASVDFFKKETGEVNRMILSLNGQTVSAKRN